MADLPPPPSLDTVPPAPQRKDGKEAFNLRADPFLAALPALAEQINKATAWISSALTDIAASVKAAALSATKSDTSAKDAAKEVVKAADQAKISTDAATASKGYRDSAAAIAAAMGNEAGLPNMVGQKGRPLIVNPAENGVIWGSPVFMDASQTGNFTAITGSSYWLSGSFVVTLPAKAGLAVGNFVTLSKALSAVPTVKTTGGVLIKTPKGQDTSVLYDLDAQVTFVWNGTAWEV